MKSDLVKKANGILEEIEDLNRYKTFLKGEHKDVAHFRILQHFGSCGSDSLHITISRRHNNRLFKVVDEIIQELQSELDSL